MNKIFKKIIATACAVTLSLGVCGCSQGGIGGGGTKKNSLEIYYWSSGYGREYMDAVVNAFTADNPDVTVDLIASGAVMGSDIWDNPDDITTDLYFTTIPFYNAYTSYLEPLDDVLETEVDGKPLKEKFSAETLSLSRSPDGKTYSVPYALGVGGMVYNATVFEEKGFTVPKTTSQFADLCTDIISDQQYTPFIHYKDYWNYMLYSWMAQYAGADNFSKLWDGVFVDENGNEKINSVEMFSNNKAKEVAASVVCDLTSPKNFVYVGSNTISHTTAQTYLLNRKGLMGPTGSWLENEMKNSKITDTFKMMKTPVVSELGTKLGLKENEFAAIISYIDGDATDAQKSYAETVDEKIVERIREARNLYVAESQQFTTLIPKNSTKKDLAKKFLAYYYSDKALEITETTCKMILPVKYSDGTARKHPENDTQFLKSCLALTTTGGKRIDKVYKVPLFYNGAIEVLYHFSPVEKMTYGNDSQTLKEYIASENKWWNDNWSSIISDAGL